MTRIDFYLSKDTENSARHTLACRIVEKAYQLGNHIHIHTESTEQTQLMDDLLWTFRDGSFLPHQKSTDNRSKNTLISIGNNKDFNAEADVLINLAQNIPSFFSQFERVAELVNEDPQYKTQARDRYKFYRDRGYDLKTHNL